MTPTKKEIVKTFGKEFLEVLERRLDMLKKMGYSTKKISELIKYKSRLKEFLEISREINYPKKLEFLLNEMTEEINAPIFMKDISPNKKIKNSNLEVLEKLLEKYIQFMFLGFSGLVKESKIIGNEKITTYFDLKIKYSSNIIKSFPYSEIHIMKNKENFVVFAREEHPGSRLVEINDLSEIINKINFVNLKIEEKVKDYTKKEWLNEFVFVLFNSMFSLTNELGLAGKKPQKIFKNIENFIE